MDTLLESVSVIWRLGSTTHRLGHIVRVFASQDRGRMGGLRRCRVWCPAPALRAGSPRAPAVGRRNPGCFSDIDPRPTFAESAVTAANLAEDFARFETVSASWHAGRGSQRRAGAAGAKLPLDPNSCVLRIAACPEAGDPGRARTYDLPLRRHELQFASPFRSPMRDGGRRRSRERRKRLIVHV
jgi:hypothetical protein